MRENRYKAFISYSRSDALFSRWLHRALESYNPPRSLVSARGFSKRPLAPIFRDQAELGTSPDLSKEIQEAIESAEWLIVVCSPAAVASEWVEKEIQLFQELNGSNQILCVIADGDTDSTSVRYCFPPALFKEDEWHEPLAADGRTNGDGKRLVVVKLAAGLLEVPLDELVKRDTQRRTKRMAGITITSFVSMLLMGGLAVFASLARNEAQLQEKIAREALADAKLQRARAETEAQTSSEVIEYLVDLFELANPSEAAGELVSAKDLLDRGARRIDKALTERPVVQQRMLRTIGRAYASLGNTKEADRLISAALSISKTLTLKGEIASNTGYLAELRNLQGRYGESLTLWQSSLQLQIEVHGSSSEKAATAHLGYGLAAYFQNRNDLALSHLNSALEIRTKLHGTSSKLVGDVYYALGLVGDITGEYQTALDNFFRARDIYENNDSSTHVEYLLCLKDMANLQYKLGQYSDALATFEKSTQLADKLFPEEHIHKIELQREMSAALEAEGLVDQAEKKLQQAVKGVTTLGTHDTQVARTLEAYSLFLIRQQRISEAIPYAEKSHSLFTKHYGPKHWELGRSANNLGAFYLMEGKFSQAEQYFRESKAIRLSSFGEIHPDVANSNTNIADVLNQQDKYTEAEKLARAGFDVYSQTVGESHWRTLYARSILADSLRGLNQFGAAYSMLDDSCELLQEARGNSSYTVRCYTTALKLAQASAEDAENVERLETILKGLRP